MKSEQVVYDVLSSSNFVQQLVSYFSLEEVKGKDKYNTQRYILFKVHNTWLYMFIVLVLKDYSNVVYAVPF